MNKYLMMSAAGVMAVTGSAATTTSAVAHSGATVVGLVISFSGSYISACNPMELAWFGDLYGLIDFQSYCGVSDLGIGTGISGKTKGIGSNVSVADSANNTWTVQADYDFGLGRKGPSNFYPWAVYFAEYTTSGVDLFEGDHGYYVLEGAHVKKPAGKGPNATLITKDSVKHASMVKKISINK